MPTLRLAASVVPRTATVTAATDVELESLERDDFLLAVTGTPGALDEADRLVATYLAEETARGDVGRGMETGRHTGTGG